MTKTYKTVKKNLKSAASQPATTVKSCFYINAGVIIICNMFRLWDLFCFYLNTLRWWTFSLQVFCRNRSCVQRTSVTRWIWQTHFTLNRMTTRWIHGTVQFKHVLFYFLTVCVLNNRFKFFLKTLETLRVSRCFLLTVSSPTLTGKQSFR